MTQCSRDQPFKETNLAKCRSSRWNGSPAFKTWAPLANKWRKGIATSSWVISCNLFSLHYFKIGEPRSPDCNDKKNSLLGTKRKCSCNVCVNNIVLFVTVSRHAIHHLIIWLAPRAGKMNQIARCDWLPERARWSHLARSGLPAVSRKQNFTKSHIINPLLTKFVRSRWLDIGLVLFLRVYGPRLRLGP